MTEVGAGLTLSRAAEPLALPPRSERSRALESLRRARLAMVGIALLALVLLAAVFAPQLSPHDPNDVVPANRLKPPGLLGGDPGFPLAAGFIAVLISGVIGVTLGLLAGYYRGALDDVVGRIADVQLAFPAILLY